jgi:hypothetical protein
VGGRRKRSGNRPSIGSRGHHASKREWQKRSFVHQQPADADVQALEFRRTPSIKGNGQWDDVHEDVSVTANASSPIRDGDPSGNRYEDFFRVIKLVVLLADKYRQRGLLSAGR